MGTPGQVGFGVVRIAARHVTGWLWQWFWFRRAVLWVVVFRYSPDCVVRWLIKETPFTLGLRDLHLRLGDFFQAAVCADVLREWGDL